MPQFNLATPIKYKVGTTGAAVPQMNPATPIRYKGGKGACSRSLNYQRISVLLSLTLLLATLSLAQRSETPIRLRTDLVTIDVAVTDKNGNYIRDLRAEDFVIYQDGQPQKTEFFEASEQTTMTRPLAIVFALDTSGSIKPEEVVKQRTAAESFIRLLPPGSLFALAVFNTDFKVIQKFTDDSARISRAFSRLGDKGGNSKIFQSIDRSVSLLKRAPPYKNGRRLRRVVIVISDGYDNVDRPDEQEHVIRRANEAGVTVYSITLPSYATGLGRNQRVMTLLDASRIVPGTGGKDFSADDKDFEPVLRSIAEEIRASYSLSYYPPRKEPRGTRDHQIRVEVTRSGAIVRASRSSYRNE